MKFVPSFIQIKPSELGLVLCPILPGGGDSCDDVGLSGTYLHIYKVYKGVFSSYFTRK